VSAARTKSYLVKSMFFLIVTTCKFVNGYQFSEKPSDFICNTEFGGLRSSAMFVSTYETACCHYTKDHSLYFYSHENIKLPLCLIKHHAMKAYWRYSSTSLHALDKKPPVTIELEAERSKIRSRCCGEQKDILARNLTSMSLLSILSPCQLSCPAPRPEDQSWLPRRT
jgi:hypothetical protein